MYRYRLGQFPIPCATVARRQAHSDAPAAPARRGFENSCWTACRGAASST